jgi:hypothetical protein
MRRYLSWAAIGAVGATALAATIDALAADGSTEASRPSAARPERPAKRPSIPDCNDSQLSFGIEVIDAPVAVLEHVRGESCRRRPDRPVEVVVRTASAQAGGIIFGPEGSLGGTFSPGAERRAAFRYRRTCGEQGPFLAVARSGSFFARRRIPFERRCVPLTVHGVIRLGPGPDEGYVAFWAPDPAVYAFRVRISMLRGALTASLELPSLELSLHKRFSTVGCRRRGTKETCIFHYPLLPAGSSGRWVGFVRKTSAKPATVRFRIAFEAVR